MNRTATFDAALSVRTPKVDTCKVSSHIAYSNVSYYSRLTCDRNFLKAVPKLIERESANKNGMLSAKLYSRRLTRVIYSCCIGTVIHRAV